MSKITLEDFLLTHSKIDKLFIYDFFMIQKIGKDSVNKPFIMDLELIAKWLGTGKKILKIHYYVISFKFLKYIVLIF